MTFYIAETIICLAAANPPRVCRDQIEKIAEYAIGNWEKTQIRPMYTAKKIEIYASSNPNVLPSDADDVVFFTYGYLFPAALYFSGCEDGCLTSKQG